MRIYTAHRTIHSATVTAEGPGQEPAPLSPVPLEGLPADFEWGYLGGGPRQLALALLVDYHADFFATIFVNRGFINHCARTEALRLYEAFAAQVVAAMPREWTLSSEDLALWVGTYEVGNHAGRQAAQEHFARRWAGIPK